MEQNNNIHLKIKKEVSTYLRLEIEIPKRLREKEQRAVRGLLNVQDDVKFIVRHDKITAEYQGEETPEKMEEKILFNVRLSLAQYESVLADRTIGGI